MSAHMTKKTGEGRPRSPESRKLGAGRVNGAGHDHHAPAAGAHAADHLINEDATPGAGALPSAPHRSGREVDGGAG